MAAAAYHLENISDTLDPKADEWLNKVKRLLRIALEQQAKSLVSLCRGAPCPSQATSATNEGYSNT